MHYKNNGGVVSEVNTDSVAAVFADNKNPFATTIVNEKV